MAQTYTDDCFATDHVVQTDMGHIEENFAALKSAFSGATTPSNTVAGMWWYDTTANILKLRNEANSAWQSVWDFANNKPVVTNLSNEITGAMIAAAIKDPAAGTAGLRTLGTTSIKACAGDDARLSNERTPTNGSVTSAKFGNINASITQARLKTSVQDQNYDIPLGTHHNFILTGGQYCFLPTIKGETTSIQCGGRAAITTSYATVVSLYNSDVATQRYGYVYHRYVTTSGDVHWIFILRNKITKEVVGISQAPDHPCFGNGGKPLLVPHPFGNYDETKYEIVVINPSLEEIEQMESETIVDDETKPNRSLLQVITEDYEIDEDSNPAWPSIPVTVGLPKHIKDKKTGKKVLADYRFMNPDTIIEPIKKVIPKPSYIKVKKLRRK